MHIILIINAQMQCRDGNAQEVRNGKGMRIRFHGKVSVHMDVIYYLNSRASQFQLNLTTFAFVCMSVKSKLCPMSTGS